MTHEMTHETILQLIDQIPDTESFLTVAELDQNSQQLALDYPDLVDLQELAKSPEGRPIYSLTIGSGEKSVLLFDSPHPNEPAGSMMLDFLARALAENELLRQNLRWHIIKTLDVDGATRNEPWFNSPHTLRNYAHDYYRSTGYENTEWTYPIDYKSHRFQQLMSRFDFLQDLMDTKKPTLIFSFHSTDFGPSCWYPKASARPIWDQLAALNLKYDLPFFQLDNDEYNVPPFAPGHFLDFQDRTSDETDEATEDETDVRQLLVTEVPRFLDPRADDETYLDYLRGDAAKDSAEQGFMFGQLLESLYRPISPYVASDNPYAKLVVQRYEHFRDNYERRLRHIDINPIYRDRCKVSEAFFNYEMPKLHRLLYWALLRRSCEFELAKGEVPGSRILEKVRSEAERLFDETAHEVEQSFHYSAVPIRKLMSVQLETVLLALMSDG